MTRNPKDAEFARVCAELPKLTPAQLEQVRLRAGFLAGTSGTRDATPALVHAPEDDDWLLRGIEAELRRRGVLGRGRVPAARLVPDWAARSAKARADLLGYLRSGAGGSARDEAALGRLAARALADYLARGRVPVGPKTLLANVDKVLSAIDAAFPGYLEAGLLRCCLDPAAVGAA
jgi:hypothetical protein